MSENKHKISDLYQMQSLPLKAKIQMTKVRLRGWIDEFGEDGVYVSFSGGKDSTVLLDIVRNECGYNNVPAVFVDVPTQYPELRDFAKTWDNVEIIRPKISFMEVCEKYGFPLISKEVSDAVDSARKYVKKSNGEYNDKYKFGAPVRVLQLYGKLPHTENGVVTDEYSKRFDKSKYLFFLDAPFEISNMCCKVMKKNPLHDYSKRTGRKPITAQMASESRLRTSSWLKHGCNAFDTANPISNPMSFWTEQDVLKYIKQKNLPICSVYGNVIEIADEEQVEGQMSLINKPQQLKTTGCQRTGCMLCGFGCHLEKGGEERFLLLKQTHPKMYNLLDVCKNNGVTFREAIEWTNEHGNLDIKL